MMRGRGDKYTIKQKSEAKMAVAEVQGTVTGDGGFDEDVDSIDTGMIKNFNR